LIEGGNVIYKQQFYVGMDMVDAQGVVYFARYWDWYEHCFEGLLQEASGKTWGEIVASGMGIPYVHCEIDYKVPVRLSDVVEVDLVLARIGARSLHFRGRFHNAEGTLVATAATIHTPVSSQVEKPEIPTWLSQAVTAEMLE